MKRIMTFVALIISLSLFAKWVDIPENSAKQLISHSGKSIDQIRINLSLDGYNLETVTKEGRTYQKITYENEGKFIQEGMPELPRFTRLIAIPDVGDVEYEIISSTSKTISDINVYPAQKLQIESEPFDNTFTIDENFYHGKRAFPNNLIELGTPAIMRDLRVVKLTINPFVFDPSKKELTIMKDIEVLVKTTGKSGSNKKLSHKKRSKYFESIYNSSIINYSMISTRTDEYQNPCILYIYPEDNNVFSALEYLSDWKHQKGFDVVLASTDQTGTSSSSIKNYIQNAYDNWQNPPIFVTLVGDASGSYSIPTFFETWSGYGGEGDHPYSQLEGNDILADIIIGRLSFSNIIELQTIVAKVLGYEKDPFMGSTDWYERTLLVGDPSSSGPSCIYTKQFIKEMIDFKTPNISSVEVYYGNFSNQTNTWLNNGVSYFNYRGWLGMSGFGTDDIYNLNNNAKLPFAVFLTCGTGSFANEESRSEAFIRAGSPANQKGAIAAIGTATTGTHTTFNNCVDTGIFYGVFTDKIFNPGGALIRGKLHLYTSFPNNPSNKVNINSYWNNLMGDPSVELWTGIPQNMNVTYDTSITSGTNYLEIVVEDDNGFPIEDAWVTALQGEDDIFVSDHTDSEGNVFLPIEVQSNEQISITVTKHNYKPHLGSIDITQQNLALNANLLQIDDDNSGTSSGNNDGIINPGENIELRVGILNSGSQSASSVSATISTEDDFVTISDNTEDFGTIAAGNTVFCNDDFDISINPNVLGGHEIHLLLDIEDDNGNQWQDHIIIPIEGINLYPSEYSILDDPNGIFEPGETVEMVITLFNTGAVDAQNIEGVLHCEDPSIDMIDSLAVFETILSGDEGDNNADRFEVSASYDVIPGSQKVFTLELTNSNGYDNETTFIVEVGEVAVTDPLGPDSYGYSCYDSEDINYEHAPEYNWYEIDPANGGEGTSLNLNDSGDEGDVGDISLPFTLYFYGFQYNNATVCSNGWIAPGGATQASFMNSAIPGPQGPSPMIAPFWDDLRTSPGNVYYYFDEEQHRFIIQWSDMQTDYSSSPETFQMIICDPNYYSTPTGDSEIIFQYQEVNNNSYGSYSGYSIEHGQYATVGLEDHTFAEGLQYTYNNSYPVAAKELEDGLALKFTTAGSVVLDPPVAAFSTDSFQFTLLQNETESDVLEITNLGQANLLYSVTKDYVRSDQESKGHGGPDNYGYQWFDSEEPNGPAYNWRDISNLGTEVTFTHNDIGTDLMPIGFDFYFYGNNYNEFRINPNGWIGFGDDNEEWNNLSLPHPDAPRPAILPFWDDLDPIQGGNVYYYSTSDSLIVWFDDIIHYPGNYNGTYDFQIILYETGRFIFQYRDMEGDVDSSTIGIQNEDASDALQITYNGNFVQNEFAVEFMRIVEWLDISQNMGFIEAGATETININVDALDLDLDEYQCNLIIDTNDPSIGQVTIPVIMNVVADYPMIDISEESIDFGTQMIGDETIDTLVVSNLGTGELEVTDITNSVDDFSLNITNFTLLTGESQELEITFAPSSEGIISDTLHIHSNDPNDPELLVTLNGVGEDSSNVNEDLLPRVTNIYQNYPNPFNPVTTITFDIKSDDLIFSSIEIFNVKGQKIRTLVEDHFTTGTYQVIWDGKDRNHQKVSSGVYFYKFKSGNFGKIKKMLLIK